LVKVLVQGIDFTNLYKCLL